MSWSPVLRSRADRPAPVRVRTVDAAGAHGRGDRYSNVWPQSIRPDAKRRAVLSLRRPDFSLARGRSPPGSVPGDIRGAGSAVEHADPFAGRHLFRFESPLRVD